MGLQAAATRGVAPGRSTTYLTGTLTGLLTELSALGVRPDWAHRAAIVIALVFGALAGAMAFSFVPLAAPLIPLLVLVGIVLIAATSRGDGARS